jgi:YD repeat-containing protein
MKTKRLLAGILCLLIAGEFMGCSDHLGQVITPGANRMRVKTITQVTGTASVSMVSAFSYDVQGRLNLITAYQLPDSTVAPVENTLYQYDAQSRLTQVRHTTVRRGSNSETYTLTYNSTNQVVQLSNSISTFNISPQYNSGNLVTGYRKGIAVGGLSSTGGGTLTFTGNNVTASSDVFSVFRTGGSPTAPAVYSRSINTTYTFDDKLNPFYGVFIIPAPGVFHSFAGTGSFGPYHTLYGGTDNLFNLSRNNVLVAVTANETTNYRYTYNSSSLPTSRITTTTTGISEILRYDYESY